MFTCQVSRDQSHTRLQWMVQFVSVSMSPIEEFFLGTDSQGKVIERSSNGISLCFYSHQIEAPLNWSHR